MKKWIKEKSLIIGVIAIVFIASVAFIGVKAADNAKIKDLIELANVVNEGNSDAIVAAASLLDENASFGGGSRYTSGISTDSTSPSAGEVRTTTLTVTGDSVLSGTLGYTEKYEALTATNTIAIAESGTTYYLSGSWQEHTLPATSTPGQIYRFYVGGALSATTTIVTADGVDSINGTLQVAGAVVDCDDEDTMEFVDNLENIGDFFELRTDGTDWFIGASGALTGSALTCSAS